MPAYYSYYFSPVGKLLMTGENLKLFSLVFDDEKMQPSGNFSPSQPAFAATKKWLNAYFRGERPDFTPSLDFSSLSPFRERVIKETLKIPYGETVSYGAIARNIEKETGKRVSAQAVGGAVGANRFVIIVPCHRVIGSDGGLTGYSAGLDKKIALLKTEKIIL